MGKSPSKFGVDTGLPIPIRLVLGLLALVGLGTLVLMLPVSAQGDPLAFNEAVFTAVSALSVTGLSLITPATDLSLFGQAALMLLILLGGVGYMVLAVLVLSILGRRISLIDRLALQDSLDLASVKGIVALAQRILGTVLVIQLAGAAAFYLHWRSILPDHEAAFRAGFHAVSSFCNAGFDLFAGDPRFPAGLPTDTTTLAIKSALIIVGGLGAPVVFELVGMFWRRRISLHTRLTLAASLFLLVWGAVGLFASEHNGVLASLPLGRQIELSVFQSISSRTAGFAGLPQFESLSPASQLMILTLMFIGCGPASMGGGVTTGTFVVLVLALWTYVRGRSTPIVAGRAIPGEMVRKAASVLTVSLFAVLTATWLILLTHDTTLDKAVFEVVSAFATTGLTLAFTSELNGFGQFIIILMMFWGRLGALTLLAALTKKEGPRRVEFPEEKILIG